VEFVTGDFVTLKGFYYPGNRGKASPTVLLLHAPGEDSNKAEWVGLAKELNKKGYAVLRFDFRGHGESTSVNPGKPNPNPMLAVPGFWDKKENQGIKGANKRPTVIDAKLFPKGYLPILANDIEAAKAWLDTQDCDAHNLVLVGAKEGATVGALWLNAAWSCYPIVTDPNKFGQKVPDIANPVGKSVTAAVWLSMSSQLDSRTVSVTGLLHTAAENKTPMWFLYGPQDSKAKATAVACEKAFRKGKKGTNSYVAQSDIKGAEKLSGSALLSPSLKTPSYIAQYLGNAAPPRKNALKSRPTPEAYVWQFQYGGRIIQQPSQVMGNPAFFSFQPFLR
jgi:hypothetical protein